MNNCIYGVDLSKPVTPMMVRDALIECFLNAHGSILDDMKDQYKDSKEFNQIKEIDIKMTIKKFFKDVGGDFDNPTKESILKVMGKLQEFSANFRKPKIIERHAGQMMLLVEKL
ncbi:MAG: hypothetical protein ABH828_01165 [archaeon]